MFSVAPPAPERVPRRARYLIPQGTPRRAEILAGLAVLAVIGGLSLVPAVVGLVVAFHAVSKASRMRPSWLTAPAACGLAWTLAIGPRRALAGILALPDAVAATCSRIAADPAASAAAGRLAGGFGRWLPGQLPIALPLAAGVAAAAWWLDWLHTDEERLPAVRPGLVSWCRGSRLTAVVSAGGVVTRTGVCLGLDVSTGRAVEISWGEAGRGVLVAGAQPQARASGWQILHAAIRRRKPVIAVDLSASGELAGQIAAVCAVAKAPLQAFGAAGGASYEPWRGAEPGQAAALLMAAIDWDQAPDAARASCQGWLSEVLAVAAAAPGEPARALLEELARLLAPGVLRARIGQVPSYHPRRDMLAERALRAASRLEADRESAEYVAGQLAALRGSALGRWLGPGAPRIELADTVRRRGVALFSVDPAADGPAAVAIANVIALDAAAAAAGVRRNALPEDGLVWLCGCEAMDAGVLAALTAAGAAAGLATVMITSSAQAAAAAASCAGVLLVHRPAGPPMTDLLGPAAGGPPGPAAGRRGAGEFTMVVREPAGRVVRRARSVPAREVPASSRPAATAGAPR